MTERPTAATADLIGKGSLSSTGLPETTGVILAGGRSLRYGCNKALVAAGEVSLIERVLKVLRELFGHNLVVTNNPKDYAHLRLPMVADRIRGLGPIGGIHAALPVLPTAWGFFTACDMPSLSAPFIRYMHGLRENHDVVVPIIDGKMEALHAFYHRRCFKEVEALIAKGVYQVIRVFPQLRVRYVTEEEIRAFDPELGMFKNINRPEELRAFLKNAH